MTSDLVFYGTHKKVSHVMALIGNGQCAGEAGGSPRCYSVEISKKLGACMKVRPVAYRKDVIGREATVNTRRHFSSAARVGRLL